MAGQLKEVRNRITSIRNSQQITKAMKMVSAAKLRRAQDAIIQMRPYAQKLQELLSNIVSSSEGDLGMSLAVERPVEKVLLIVITSDRGLAGAYNSNLIKLAKLTMREKYLPGTKTTSSSEHLGKKATNISRRTIFRVHRYLQRISSSNSASNTCRPLHQAAVRHFENREFDAIELVYSQFRNAATQTFTVERFLPIPKVEKKAGTANADFIFEPGKEELVAELMPKILNTQLYKAVLDANASEHGARMTAMDKASDNANELLKSLRLSYNRARQAAITTELTEIVSGAAALQG